MSSSETGNYEYVSARVRSRRAYLYGDEEYRRFVRMGPGEISRYMEETTYAQEVNEFGARYKGVDLIEYALNHNLASQFEDLLRWSEGELYEHISRYLKKFDAWNVKTILRGIYAKEDGVHLRAIARSGTESHARELIEPMVEEIRAIAGDWIWGEDEETPAAELQGLIGVAEQWITLDPNSRSGYLILVQAVNKTGDEDRTQELIQHIGTLEVGVLDLVLQRIPEGGAIVSGSLENIKADPGMSVTLVFTFYDQAGNALGTQTTQVRAGAQAIASRDDGEASARHHIVQNSPLSDQLKPIRHAFAIALDDVHDRLVAQAVVADRHGEVRVGRGVRGGGNAVRDPAGRPV